jgi:hypothetical protein
MVLYCSSFSHILSNLILCNITSVLDSIEKIYEKNETYSIIAYLCGAACFTEQSMRSVHYPIFQTLKLTLCYIKFISVWVKIYFSSIPPWQPTHRATICTLEVKWKYWAVETTRNRFKTQFYRRFWKQSSKTGKVLIATTVLLQNSRISVQYNQS